MIARVGVVGLGDMGSGLAKNLIHAGFETSGFDLSKARMDAFAALGGHPAANAKEVGQDTDAVLVMVMNGAQARSTIFGANGLLASMKAGSAILMTATIAAKDVLMIADEMSESGVYLIDTPVSGGFSGAQSGNLTMMAAAPDDILDRFQPVMEAVSSSIHRVGTKAGMGQTVKACLQSLIGAIFTATFEATVLAGAAGVNAKVLQNVISASSAGSIASNTAVENIIAGRFEATGSHIRTMHKDMTLVVDLARDLGVPLFTASTAMQLFQAGITKFPHGDNWAVTRVLEDIVGSSLRQQDDLS